MRIAFVCGGLGLGGVADYTRLLAAALKTKGVESLIISLADREARALARDTEGDLPTLVIPAATPWRERVAAAETALETFAPDWVSLQFVPFAFNRKGVIAAEGQWLARLLGRHRLQIMLHELWVEPLPGRVALRRRVLRAAQRSFILRLLKHAKPALLHTSNAAYQALLAEAGLQTKPLPLFGNIPIDPKADRAWFGAALSRAGIDLTRRPLLFGFFGGVDPNWDPGPLLGRLIEHWDRSVDRVWFCRSARPDRSPSACRLGAHSIQTCSSWHLASNPSSASRPICRRSISASPHIHTP